MEIDKREIMNKLDSISDDDLRNMVRAIAQSAGISSRRAEMAASDIGKLKKSFAGMSDKELQKALSMLDGETVDDIKRRFNM